MTLKEYDRAADALKRVPITIESELKPFHPIGLMMPGGTFLPATSSNVGKAFNDPDTGQWLVTVWDGGKVNPKGGFTKGEILSESTKVHDSTHVMKEHYGTAQGVGGHVPRATGRDCGEGTSSESGEGTTPEPFYQAEGDS